MPKSSLNSWRKVYQVFGTLWIRIDSRDCAVVRTARAHTCQDAGKPAIARLQSSAKDAVEPRSGQRFHVLVVLINCLVYTGIVAAWSYRYADLNVAHAGFSSAQRRMRLYLNFWLAACSVQIIFLILFW
ncbi:MAG: hypothetical protein EHM61_04865 [Acidobacteria bacterium]|nr:MAG: hypothetical protein EHM61_04865 [Acidobacteriota bacterium]